jgi:hypothetical protein
LFGVVEIVVVVGSEPAAAEGGVRTAPGTDKIEVGDDEVDEKDADDAIEVRAPGLEATERTAEEPTTGTGTNDSEPDAATGSFRSCPAHQSPPAVAAPTTSADMIATSVIRTVRDGQLPATPGLDTRNRVGRPRRSRRFRNRPGAASGSGRGTASARILVTALALAIRAGS